MASARTELVYYTRIWTGLFARDENMILHFIKCLHIEILNTDECLYHKVNIMFADVLTMWGINSSAGMFTNRHLEINISIIGIADLIVEAYT